MRKIKVLMVCLGNICRSPSAQGMLEKQLQQHPLQHLIIVDSAGTAAYNVGRPPDSRAQQVALSRGIDLSAQRARQVNQQDFKEFDYILAMDRSNLASLQQIAPTNQLHKIQLLLSFAKQPHLSQEIPDPYYGDIQGFEQVLDLIEIACEGFLAHTQKMQQCLTPEE